MAKSNNSDAFKIQRDMMLLTGVWPVKNPTFFYILRGVLTWVISTAVCTTMWIDAIHDSNDFTKLSEILYVMLSVTAFLIKLAGFTKQRHTFFKLINDLKDPIFLSYPDELDHYMATSIKISSFMTNAYRYLCGACIMMFSVFPILDKKPLPLPFPYDTGNYRYLMYVFQLSGMASAAWNNSCLDTLTTSLMGIAIAQFDILAEKIVKINEHIKVSDETLEDDKEIIKKLNQCVKHHLAIIDCVEYIEKIFTFGLLSQFLGSIIVICNTSFHILLISVASWQFVTLAGYFGAMIMQLYLYCWYGNQLMVKSVGVGEACYLMDWNKCGSRVRKHLFMIMERSRRPLSVTALKFCTLSLRLFATIIQWSYSYFALLKKLYNKVK